MAVRAPNIQAYGRNIEPQAVNPRFVERDALRSTWFGKCVDFAETQYGTLRILQLGDKAFQVAARLLKSMGDSMSPAVEYCEKNASTLRAGWTVLCVPHALKMWASGTRAIADWPQDGTPEAARERVQRVHDASEALSIFGHVGKLFMRSTALGHLADVSGLVSDAADLKMSREDMHIVQSNQGVDGDLRAALDHKMRHSALKAAKAVLSVLSGIAAVMAIFSMTAFFSPGFLLASGLTSASLAVAAHFYKARVDETTRLGIIDFFDTPRAHMA